MSSTFEQAKAEMDGVGEREDAAVVLQRVDPLPVEGDFFRQIKKAKLAQVREDRAEHEQSPSTGRSADGQAGRKDERMVDGGLRVDAEPGFAAQMVGRQAAERVGQAAAEVPEDKRPAINRPAEARSWLRTTWPSSRAFWRR